MFRCLDAARLAAIVLAVSIVYGPSVAAGQDPPSGAATSQAPALDALVARALERAPSIAARRARLAAAEAVRPAAGLLPDPMVEFEYRDAGFPRQTLGSDPMSMVGAMVQQPLLTGARRRASRAVAASEVQQRRAEVDAWAGELTAAVREQYARLYTVDREQAVLRDALQIADLLATTASSRYAAGESDQASVLRTQLERTRVGERLADLEGERAILVAGLNRLTDDPIGTVIGEVTSLPELPALPAGLDVLPELAAAASPEVGVRQAEVALAGERLTAARAELGTNLTLGGGFYWQGNSDRVVTLTLGFELPFRRNRRERPMIAASEREAEAARLELRDASASARAQAAQLVAEIKRAEDQLVRYRTGLLPQSSAALDAARAGYLGGRGEFAAALDEFRRWTEIRVEVARREAARFAALGRLHVLVAQAAAGEGARKESQS